MKHILIVDDEKDLAEAVMNILQLEFKNERMRIHQTQSPGEAYIKASNQKFDLVISDFYMPKTNGGDLIQSIRKMKHNAETPIIMISGLPDDARKMMKDQSKVLIIGKPFDFNELVDTVHSILKGPSARAA